MKQKACTKEKVGFNFDLLLSLRYSYSSHFVADLMLYFAEKEPQQ